ncbi:MULTISPECIES: hypothetical protein [Bacilli]|uniref:hypothetical protein n=1 Tax=Bacilli TaxID=91061 RepID=UPI0015948D6E|nr:MULTISPECIES: hypothetical protein [Bacilli]MCH1736584.1 hypothetical protein [Enterococcus faecalis]MDT2061432.1 hypothetical protein [Enterococcus faecalis]NVE20714.1 hypothetical protein [Staphylococcus aureus]
MLTNKDKKFYEKVAREKGNLGKNKYLFCDLHSQQIGYYLTLNSLDKAKEHFERLAYLLEMMEPKDRPEWYTIENLENDRKKIEQLEKRKEWK